MKNRLILALSIFFVLSSCELPAKKQKGYHSFGPQNIKKPIPALSGRRTLVLQIRSDHRVPIVIKRPHPQQLMSHQLRPIKMALNPHFILKSTPLMGKYIRKPHNGGTLKFTSPKSPSEYIYEKPFSPAPEIHSQSIENNIHLPNDNNFGPIHTIPAPNLGTHDNQIHYEQPVLTTRPSAYHHNQYQVTEEPTNDQTILDPFSGQSKYFAPDPDPSLPAPKIRPSLDPHSIPSNGKPLPSDVHHNYLSTTSATGSLPQGLPFHSAGGPQLFDPYGMAISNQPQLQQFLLQQGTSAQTVPLSVYNPTYLVAQSNSLYNQHQQQLFKPNPNYLESLNSNYATADMTQDVASDGQILQAAKDNANHIHPQFSNLQDSTTQDIPTFAALVSGPSDHNIEDNLIEHHFNHHGQLQAVSNAFNLGSTGVQGGFVVSNFFGKNENPESYQQYIDLSQRHHESEHTVQRPNLHLQQQHLAEGNFGKTQAPPNSAYEEHQRLVQQTLNNPSPLRIFVPDDEFHTTSGYTLTKRSDDFSSDSIEHQDEDDSYISSEKESDENKENDE